MKLPGCVPKHMDIFEAKAGLQDTDFKQVESTLSTPLVASDFVCVSLEIGPNSFLCKKGICLSTYFQSRTI